MTASRTLDVDQIAPRAAAGIRILPVVHEQVEMAAVARAVLDALDPAGVAVELPTSLIQTAEAAVRRLPLISVLVSKEPGEDALVWVVAPGDPFVEALRWAVEKGRARFAIDPDLPPSSDSRTPIPDTYSVWSLGPETLVSLLRDSYGAEEPTELDRRREAGMAFHARRAARELDGELLVLTGAAHAAGLARALNEPQAHPMARVHRSSTELRHLHPDALAALLPDPPLAHAAWEVRRQGRTVDPVEPAIEETWSRRVSLTHAGFTVITGEGDAREQRRRRSLVLLAASQGCRPLSGEVAAPDRRALAAVVWKVAAGSYREQTDETLAPWQRRLFFDYATRYARVQGLLAAGLWEWVVAGRGVGDDNLAWECFDAARTYPWQEDAAELPTAHIDGDELDLGTRKVRFRRRFFHAKRRPVRVPIHRRPAAGEVADWLAGFDSDGLCSYPPEDLVVEDYGRHLQRKAASILATEQARVEPFSTGTLDGIDIRETLRHLAEGTIYVREMGQAPAAAGSVVVIFDADESAERFPFRMTWLGEHDQESDMAFYSTDPAQQIVGPGMLRATYGGFMLTVPRGRLYDVWTDPDYRLAGGQAATLLMAAIDYSLEKTVVHVADRPPGRRWREYAAHQGKRIVHLPLASLSPQVRKKVRVVHLLAGHDKREIARDYLW